MCRKKILFQTAFATITPNTKWKQPLVFQAHPMQDVFNVVRDRTLMGTRLSLSIPRQHRLLWTSMRRLTPHSSSKTVLESGVCKSYGACYPNPFRDNRGGVLQGLYNLVPRPLGPARCVLQMTFCQAGCPWIHRVVSEGRFHSQFHAAHGVVPKFIANTNPANNRSEHTSLYRTQSMQLYKCEGQHR